MHNTNGLSYQVNQEKKGRHKIFTLQNRNICEQDTQNLSLPLSIILALRNQIFNKEKFEPSEKVQMSLPLVPFCSHF